MKNLLLILLLTIVTHGVAKAQIRSSGSSSSSSAQPPAQPVRKPIGTVQPQQTALPETVYVEPPASQGRIQPETVYVERPAVQQPAPRPVRAQPETVYVERPAVQQPAPRPVRAQPETIYVERPPANRLAPETLFVDQPTKQQTATSNKSKNKDDRMPKTKSYEDSNAANTSGYNIPVTDYRKLIIPEDSLPSNYEERLVQAAWKNLPINRGLEAKLKMSNEYLLQARRSWYTDIVLFAQTNFTDFGNGAGAKPTISLLPLGLGAGFSFNLGQFANYNSRVRNSREGITIAQSELNYQKHFMRSETIKRYQSFLMYKNLTKNETELANEQEMTLKVVKLNFETGQVTVEEFAKIQKAYADAAQGVITSRHNMFMSKAYLEEWIGVKLEEVK